MFLNEVRSVFPLFNRSDKLQYLLLILMMFFGSFLDVLGIGAIPVFVAILAAPEKLQEIPRIGHLLVNLDIQPGTNFVVWGAVGLMLLFVLRNAFLYLITYSQLKITEHHRLRLADALFTAYLNAPWELHLARDTATIQRNVAMETTEIITGVVNPLLTLIMRGTMTILVVVLLLLTTPLASFGGVLVLALTIGAFLLLTRKSVERFGEQARVERKRTIKSIQQSLACLPEIKVLGKENYFRNALYSSMKNFARVTRLRQAIGNAMPPVLETVAVAGILGILVILVMIGQDPASLLPMVALYAAAVVRLRQYVGTFAMAINQIQFSKAAVPNVVDELELMKSLETETIGPETTEFSFGESISIANLTYTYPNVESPALKSVNIDIRRGESIGIVGSTGSGKSTLISIILGLLRQQQGQVLVDGVDIRTNIRGWLNHIGYIPQTIVLLDSSIRRNIAFGVPPDKINEAAVDAAVEAAQLQSFVQELPDGLDTVVGERGVRLSGGQRQRVGIARALYKNPDVIIMDEATAALDNQTEELLMSELNRLKNNRTFIMIAHRLSTVRNCDRLYFLKGGEVESVGNFDELMEASAGFRTMAAGS